MWKSEMLRLVILKLNEFFFEVMEKLCLSILEKIVGRS